MADRYIDIPYVDACLELSVRLSLVEIADDLNLFIEDATAETAGLLRNSGYDLPVSPIVVADVHPLVRSATMCGVWERLALRPRYSIELPSDWGDMPYRRALDGIGDGTLQLGSGQSAGSAPGGWLFSDITSKTGAGRLRGY